MSNDEVQLWLFIVVYLVYILYLNYIQNLSIVRKDWGNMKCNPLYLLIDSIVATPEAADLKFKNCIVSAKKA